jgi:redox-regulated HSP33 family molecular chaperone
LLRDLLTTSAFIAVMLAIYRFRHDIIAALVRFDQRNVRRIADEQRDRTDPIAHFRHTLKVAEEQVEEVGEITVRDPRLGTDVVHYVFEGEQFTSRFEAERVRAEKIRNIARGFYVELPRALAQRKSDDKLN